MSSTTHYAEIYTTTAVKQTVITRHKNVRNRIHYHTDRKIENLPRSDFRVGGRKGT